MRRFFRIHRSTGIVLMLLALVFLGANLKERTLLRNGHTFTCKGWPYVYGLTSPFNTRSEITRILERLEEEKSRGKRMPSADLESDIDQTMERGTKFAEAVKELLDTKSEATLSEMQKAPARNIARNIAIALGSMIIIAVTMELYARHQES